GTGVIVNNASVFADQYIRGNNSDVVEILAESLNETPDDDVLGDDDDDDVLGDDDLNGANVGAVAAVGMKETGLPINPIGIIVILLFSLLASVFRRKALL
ncbi:MAG: hypothetical protein LBU74_01555, partial [Methanobacteriaceae archaeon]|nr:hypothetical protein [Candidatus Methanorudis spinitermitis]